MRRVLTILLAVGALTAPAVSTPATAATNVLQVWAPKFQERGGSTTEAEAVRQARLFNVIIAKEADYPGQSAAMHRANPALKLLSYVNGTFLHERDTAGVPEDQFLHDAAGARVRHIRYPLLFLMNPRDAGWVGSRAALCGRLMAALGHDGCGLDNLGPAPVDPTYVSAVPVDPATGQTYTRARWLADTTALAAAVRHRLAPAPVAGNGLADGEAYVDPTGPTSVLLDGVRFGMAEGFLRNGRSSLTDFPTATVWKQNLDMVIDAEQRGKPLLVITKAWSAGTQADKDQWHEFALGTYLLGAQGRARFSFSYDVLDDPAAGHPWWTTRLGAPLSAYRAVRGVYSRDFAAGRVLVNPQRTARTVSLGATCRDLRGAAVTDVVLPPHSGSVLTCY